MKMKQNKTIKMKKYQSGFMRSKARFPAMVSGWGTGKTMFVCCLKPVRECQKYPGNQWLIVRKEMTRLEDSTIPDFEKYTNLKVDSSHNVIIRNSAWPREAPDSVIMFRHGTQINNVEVLENMNLGGFSIEAAHEFDNDKEFQTLRGRLRRQDVPHFGCIGANTKGHNWIWKLWKQKYLTLPSNESVLELMEATGWSKEDVIASFDPAQYDLFEATTFDNQSNLPRDFIEDKIRLKTEAPRLFNRLVMNSWDEEEESLIYGKEVNKVIAEGRLCNVPYDPSYPVYSFSDLGIDDPTAIWFMQYIGKEVRWIDYYEANNEPLAHYWKVVQNKAYAYAKHYFPFDAGSRSLQTGITTAEQARRLGWKVEVQPRVDVLPGIEFVRAVLNQSWFDSDKCRPGFEALQAYRWQKNERLSTEEHPVYHEEPIHDWSSHAADAMRYASYVIQLHKDSLYKPRTFDFPREHKKPMVARNLIYAR